jgi:hypothetical protein
MFIIDALLSAVGGLQDLQVYLHVTVFSACVYVEA